LPEGHYSVVQVIIDHKGRANSHGGLGTISVDPEGESWWRGRFMLEYCDGM